MLKLSNNKIRLRMIQIQIQINNYCKNQRKLQAILEFYNRDEKICDIEISFFCSEFNECVDEDFSFPQFEKNNQNIEKRQLGEEDTQQQQKLTDNQNTNKINLSEQQQNNVQPFLQEYQCEARLENQINFQGFLLTQEKQQNDNQNSQIQQPAEDSQLQQQTQNLQNIYQIGFSLPQLQNNDIQQCLEAQSNQEIQVIQGYTIQGYLSKGGFGVVFKGFDTINQIEVAIKRSFTSKNESLEVTEKNQNNHLKKEEILDIFFQLINALVEIHANDIVHLDIKPQNILRNSDGIYKLTDFGISQLLKQDRNSCSEEFKGLFQKYCSPEQFFFWQKQSQNKQKYTTNHKIDSDKNDYSVSQASDVFTSTKFMPNLPILSYRLPYQLLISDVYIYFYIFGKCSKLHTDPLFHINLVYKTVETFSLVNILKTQASQFQSYISGFFSVYGKDIQRSCTTQKEYIILQASNQFLFGQIQIKIKKNDRCQLLFLIQEIQSLISCDLIQ
ncbi:hypothetical protein ABPG72_009310 [Tetrahymena utriculariae]